MKFKKTNNESGYNHGMFRYHSWKSKHIIVQLVECANATHPFHGCWSVSVIARRDLIETIVPRLMFRDEMLALISAMDLIGLLCERNATQKAAMREIVGSYAKKLGWTGQVPGFYLVEVENAKNMICEAAPV